LVVNLILLRDWFLAINISTGIFITFVMVLGGHDFSDFD